MLFLCVAVSFVEGGRGLATLLLFLYVTEEAGRKRVRDMPRPPAAECNMITNKQTNKAGQERRTSICSQARLQPVQIYRV